MGLHQWYSIRETAKLKVLQKSSNVYDSFMSELTTIQTGISFETF
jgi:hypothetical protein